MYLPSQIISKNNTEYCIGSVSQYKSRLIMYLESPRPGRLQSWLGQVRVYTLRTGPVPAKLKNKTKNNHKKHNDHDEPSYYPPPTALFLSLYTPDASDRQHGR